MRRQLAAAVALLTLGACPADGQGKTIKIGFVTTLSGPTG